MVLPSGRVTTTQTSRRHAALHSACQQHLQTGCSSSKGSRSSSASSRRRSSFVPGVQQQLQLRFTAWLLCPVIVAAGSSW